MLMMSFALAFLAVFATVVSSAPAETRQAVGCLNSFQNVPNVCANNPSGQTFFPHPSDPTKFLQCDIYNRMYIIQCPQGEVFHLMTTSCQTSQQPITTSAPVITITPAPTTTTTSTTPLPPVTTQRPVVTQAPASTSGPATCNPQSIAWGQLYFPYSGNTTKYYACDPQGHPVEVSCPALKVWDQTILSCIYSLDQSSPNKPTPDYLPNQQDNPCTQKTSHLQPGYIFHHHPDQTKFLQCDAGNGYINTCPAQLVWNAFLETCYNRGPIFGRK